MTATQTRTRSAIKVSNQDTIRKFTNLSENALNDLILDEALNFLATQCRGYRPAIDEIREEGFYWRWWWEQWDVRDAEFLAYHQIGAFTDPRSRPARETRIAYAYWHQKGIKDETLCKAYMHLMTLVMPHWRKRGVLAPSLLERAGGEVAFK